MLVNSSSNQNGKINRQCSQKPAFKGLYGLRGEVGELNAAIKLIKDHGKVDFDVLELSNEGSQKLLGIATAKHKGMGKNADLSLVRDVIESISGIITDARRLIAPSDIREFRFVNGIKRISKETEKDGLIFNSRHLEGLKHDNDSEWMDFVTNIRLKDPLPLPLAIQKLASLGKEITLYGERFHFDQKHFTNLMNQNGTLNRLSDFAQGKITALKGYGGTSVAFETENNQVLKFACKPNTPKVQQSFDVPVFEREVIPLDTEISDYNKKHKSLFSSLQLNTQNSSETWIKDTDGDEIIKAIEDNNFELDDFAPSQLGKSKNGRIFLLDVGCAKGRELWSGGAQ